MWWNPPPSNTTKLVLVINGVEKVLPAGTARYQLPDDYAGGYEVFAYNSNNQLIGTGSIGVMAPPTDPGTDPGTNPGTDPGTNPGTDPSTGGGGTEECPAGCQALKDALACPEFDEYLGKWSDMIKGTYPPPPNWHQVADIMRDSIVPAMGQEIVNRSPEIAKIIADEFESREKQVSPPPYVPDYTPPIRRMEDNQTIRGDLNSGVPDFTPSYTEDKAFSIPDPSTLDFSDNSDSGYTYKQNADKAPVYKPKTEPSTADPGYQTSESDFDKAPTYQQMPSANAPGKDYNSPDTGGPKDYQSTDGSAGNQQYEGSNIPDRYYQGR